MSPGKINANDYPLEYLGASALAATINYPLWRLSALSQSGFTVSSSAIAVLSPPYKGLLATVGGMTWARAAIFWGSDTGRQFLQPHLAEPWATAFPPFLVSTIVQIANQPIIRGTIVLQRPNTDLVNVRQALAQIYRENGIAGLWHGTSAGILKTVPKYLTAILVKDYLEEHLPEADSHYSALRRSAIKSVAAGIAGAALTNPLDVIRNEMFHTNASLTQSVRRLYQDTGYQFLTRGMRHNIIAVAIPIACTIFFTDALIQNTQARKLLEAAKQKIVQ